jgi:hypothetical protein
MIILDSGGIGEWFDNVASTAIELANKTGDSVCFLWNGNECIIVKPGMSGEEVDGLRKQMPAAMKALKGKLAIVKETGEQDEDFIKRGLEVARTAQCEVCLQYSRKFNVTVYPWVPEEVALSQLWKCISRRSR